MRETFKNGGILFFGCITGVTILTLCICFLVIALVYASLSSDSSPLAEETFPSGSTVNTGLVSYKVLQSKVYLGEIKQSDEPAAIYVRLEATNNSTSSLSVTPPSISSEDGVLFNPEDGDYLGLEYWNYYEEINPGHSKKFDYVYYMKTEDAAKDYYINLRDGYLSKNYKLELAPVNISDFLAENEYEVGEEIELNDYDISIESFECSPLSGNISECRLVTNVSRDETPDYSFPIPRILDSEGNLYDGEYDYFDNYEFTFDIPADKANDATYRVILYEEFSRFSEAGMVVVQRGPL
ncbi:MAG: hypothetical protein ACOCXP_00420 [Candidatus Dojkabacteria bacterium]